MAVERLAAKGRTPLTDDQGTGTNQPRMIVPSHTTRWSARAGMLGGLLWVLFPLGALPVVDVALTLQGSVAYYGLGYLWALLLLLMGLTGLHSIYKRSYGLLGSVGFYVSLAALVLTFVGGALKMTNTVAAGIGSTVAYLTVIMGFFILAWGSVLLGLAITGTLHNPPLYLGGLLLAIAVPLGFLFVFAAGVAWDFGFWAGLTLPYGVAWLLLGYALLTARRLAAQRPPASGQYSPQRIVWWRRMMEG